MNFPSQAVMAFSALWNLLLNKEVAHSPNAHVMGRILDKRISPWFAFHWASLMEKIIEFGDFPVAREELHEGVSDKDAGGEKRRGHMFSALDWRR